MSKQVMLIGAGVVAKGHPSSCTANVSGTVQSTGANLLSVAGTEVATADNADMHFDSHSHDHSAVEGCHDDQSHDVDPTSGKLSGILRVEGSPVYLEDSALQSDPGSGGDIDATGNGGNTILNEG